MPLIQKNRKTKSKVVFSNRSKPQLEPPLKRWITKRRTQLTSPREEGRETSDEDSSVFVKVNSQCWLTRERELSLTKQNLRKETRMISVSPRPQNADCIGDYTSNKPKMWENPKFIRKCQLLLRMAITGRMSTVKQLSRPQKSYLGRIPALLGDLQSSKSHQVFTELGWLTNLKSSRPDTRYRTA